MSTTEQAVPAAAPVPAVESAGLTKETKPEVDTAATAPAAETKAEEPTAAATEAPKEAESAEPVKKEEAKVESEPIKEGTLGYKAPGLLKSLKFSKRHFFLGEEPVSSQSLNQYLRGEKAEIAHPTAAWSSHTGEGLLFFTRVGEKKDTPAGVLNLAESADLAKDGPFDFAFKLHGHKHTFQASSGAERDRWVSALEKMIEHGKKIKDDVTKSDKYKETIGHLGKPAAAVGAGAAGAKAAETPKKSTEVTTAAEGTPNVGPSDDEGDKKAKSRSASRGNKRSSIFGNIRAKKEDHDQKAAEKKEEKKEEKAEDKKAEEAAGVAASTGVAAHELDKKEDKKEAEETPAVAPTTEAPVAAAEPAKEPETAAETTAATEPAAAAATTEKPKNEKRGSVFGSFFEKVRSPTREKKQEETFPAVPAKDEPKAAEPVPAVESATETKPEVPAKEEPKTEAEEAAAVAAPGAAVAADKKEEKKEEKKAAATPSKEKKNFFDQFKSKAKAAAPTSETKKEEKKDDAAPTVPAIKTEDPLPATGSALEAEANPAAATEEAPKEPAEETAAAPAVAEEEAKKEEPKTNGATAEKEKRRSSFFGGIGSQKKNKEGESKSESPINKLEGLFRKGSQAVRSKSPATLKKEEKKTQPEAVAEEAKTDEPAAIPEAKTEEPTTAPAAEEPLEDKPQGAIGDVVPAAVTRGDENAPPQVAASA